MIDQDGEIGKSEPAGGFWLGFFLGGLAGGAVAYFLGSDDKEKAAKKIISKGKILLETLQQFGENVEEKGEEIKEELPQVKKFFLKKGKPLVKK